MSSRDDVADHLFRRCAELTVEKGYKYFTFVNNKNDIDTSVHLGLNQNSVYFTKKHTAIATIKVFKSKKRAPANSLSAEEYLEGVTAEDDEDESENDSSEGKTFFEEIFSSEL